MKLSKRILSMLVVLVFAVTTIFTLPVSAEGFPDVPETEKYAAAVKLLSSLKIINGYEDGTFRPMNNVNRAEFTALLMRARGFDNIGSMDLADPPFPDVVSEDVSWAIGNIRTAVNLKVINGYEDGTFRPLNDVLFEEAIKMIVCAIGYENYSPEGNEWYSKYVITANSLGLLKDVDGLVGTPATRACIAQLLYNLLNTEVAKNDLAGGGAMAGESGLQDGLGLIEAEGIVSTDKVTSLTDPDVNLRENEILITDTVTKLEKIYRADNIEAYKKLFGKRIKFTYKNDKETGANVLNSYVERNSNEVSISAKNIETAKCDSSTIVYYKDGLAETSARIADNSIVIYNGKLYGSNGENSKYATFLSNESIPLVGNIRLLDNNDDGTFDIVFVDDYEIYVVSSWVTSTYTVTDNILRSSAQIILNPKTDANLKFTDKNGANLTYSSVKKGSVLSVKKSNPLNEGETLTTVVVTNENVTGTVSGVRAGKGVTINSKEYDFSEVAHWMKGSGSQTEPVMSMNATFYRDLNGDIVAYEKAETVSNQKYGYIISANKVNENMNDVLKLIVYTKDGVETVFGDEKTKINGVEKPIGADGDNGSSGTILGDLNAAAAYQGQVSTASNNVRSQVIKFTKSSKGTIEDIITAQPGDPVETIATDKLYMSKSFKAVDSGTKAKTTTSKSQIKSNVSGEKAITASMSGALLISVPNDRSKKTEYRKISTNELETQTNYDVEIYDIKSPNVSKVVVFYNLNSQLGKVKANTQPFVYTELIEVTNKDGADRYHIKGYKGKTMTEIWSAEESYSAFAALKVGDVVRFGKDAYGYATLDPKDIIFSNDSSIRATVIANHNSMNGGWTTQSGGAISGGADEGTFEMVWGYLYSVDEDAGITILDSSNEDAQHPYAGFKSALVLKYEKVGATSNIEVVDISSVDGALSALESVTKYGGASTPDEVFVYGLNNTISLVIVKEGSQSF